VNGRHCLLLWDMKERPTPLDTKLYTFDFDFIANPKGWQQDCVARKFEQKIYELPVRSGTVADDPNTDSDESILYYEPVLLPVATSETRTAKLIETAPLSSIDGLLAGTPW